MRPCRPLSWHALKRASLFAVLALGACANDNAGGFDAMPPPDLCSVAHSEPTQLSIADGGTLYGTLEIPAGCGPFPVALIIAGSGPTDRDGNSSVVGDPSWGAHTNCLKQIALALADAGWASLRYDKRGIAASRAAMPALVSDYRFEMMSDDAAEWIEQLQADGRFKGTTIIGHSQGSLVGMVAAQAKQIDSFTSLAGAGRPGGEVLREQLAAQFSGTLLAEANHIIDELEAGHTVADVSESLEAIFSPSIQPYLISWFRFDPAEEIAKLQGRVLIVQGTTDLQVALTDAHLLAAARSDAQLAIIDGMNHVLKAASTTTEQRAAYSDPTLPLHPQLMPSIINFLGSSG